MKSVLNILMVGVYLYDFGVFEYLLGGLFNRFFSIGEFWVSSMVIKGCVGLYKDFRIGF